MAEKPLMHGRDHRIGGMDPIPFANTDTVWLAVEEHFTGTMASHTDRTVDFSSSTVQTNDTGTFFSWNFSSHPWITIEVAGLFIVRFYWEIVTFETGGHGAQPSIDYVLQTTDSCPTFTGGANDPTNNGLVILADTHVDQLPTTNHTRLSSGNGNVDMSVQLLTQTADDAINVSEYYAGITIVQVPDVYLTSITD